MLEERKNEYNVVEERKWLNVPSAHSIGIATEHFRQTADDNIRIRENFHIGEVPDSLIDDNQEIILVGKGTQAR